MTAMIARVTDDTDPAVARELLEARCRRLMAARAALPDGYPNRANRAELLTEIGVALDEWLAWR